CWGRPHATLAFGFLSTPIPIPTPTPMARTRVHTKCAEQLQSLFVFLSSDLSPLSSGIRHIQDQPVSSFPLNKQKLIGQWLNFDLFGGYMLAAVEEYYTGRTVLMKILSLYS
ncbi:hypothetical protein, partial [Desulfonatronospira sp.]|uniref:hypothetical protein n=1 Tax=Desulfonatronospira sp. TaxID=1962951 RepID=UPI0025BB7D22